MRCSYCGRELEESDIFCPKCGTPTHERGGYNMQNDNEVLQQRFCVFSPLYQK